jgi:hypothetical protein
MIQCIIRDLAIQSSVNVSRRKKGQKCVQRMVENFKENAQENGIND